MEVDQTKPLKEWTYEVMPRFNKHLLIIKKLDATFGALSFDDEEDIEKWVKLLDAQGCTREF